MKIKSGCFWKGGSEKFEMKCKLIMNVKEWEITLHNRLTEGTPTPVCFSGSRNHHFLELGFRNLQLFVSWAQELATTIGNGANIIAFKSRQNSSTIFKHLNMFAFVDLKCQIEFLIKH